MSATAYLTLGLTPRKPPRELPWNVDAPPGGRHDQLMGRSRRYLALPAMGVRAPWFRLAIFGVVGVVGCGESTSDRTAPSAPDDAQVGYELCNGSADIRLGYQILGGGTVETGVPLLVQNGFRYLFVDGTCTYWAFGPGPNDGWWHTTHTGVLSEAEAATLAAELKLAEWTDRVEVDGWCDASDVVLWREGAILTWTHKCNSGPDPAGQIIPELSATAKSWVDQLSAQGAVVQTPIRLLAYPVPAIWDNPAQPAATLTFDVPSVAVSFEEAAAFTINESASLVTAPAALDELRGERTKVLAGGYLLFDGQSKVLPVRQDDILYFVYFRDTIPLEDDNGLVRPPQP